MNRDARSVGGAGESGGRHDMHIRLGAIAERAGCRAICEIGGVLVHTESGRQKCVNDPHARVQAAPAPEDGTSVMSFNLSAKIKQGEGRKRQRDGIHGEPVSAPWPRSGCAADCRKP